MEAYCRGCLKEFEPVELLQYSESNRRLFVYCTGLQVKRNDVLTFQLCKECFINLKFACKFKKQCRNSDKNFKTYLGLRNAGENIDFSTYMKNKEETFALKLHNSSKDIPLHHKNDEDDDDDDDNESTCTSIQNFMTDIRDTLQAEDMLTEDKIIREVIQEEADISDDSLDSHWLQDDEMSDFGMDFNFSEFSTTNGTNEDRCNTPQRFTTDDEDTCHYIHKDVILKSDKTIISHNKNDKLDAANVNAINQTNAEYSENTLSESNKQTKTSNVNNMPLLDDCDMTLDGIIDTNVSMTELERELQIHSVDKTNNEPVPIIPNKEIATEQDINSSFTNKFTLFLNKAELTGTNNNNVIGNHNSKLQDTDNFLHMKPEIEAADTFGDKVIKPPFPLEIDQYINNLKQTNLGKTVENLKPQVANELEQYIAKVESKNKVNSEIVSADKCSIDKNLELALENDSQVFPLEQLLGSPEVSDQQSGGSTPIINNILFGCLTPKTETVKAQSQQYSEIKDFQNLKNVVDIDSFTDDVDEKIGIFKGSIKSQPDVMEFKSKTQINQERGFKDIRKLKDLFEEDMFDEKADEYNICDSSDETNGSLKELKKINESNDMMSEDEQTIPLTDKPICSEDDMYDKVVQNPVPEDLDISITNLLDFDETRSVDLNISIASDFLEEEYAEGNFDQSDEVDDDEENNDYHNEHTHTYSEQNDNHSELDVEEDKHSDSEEIDNHREVDDIEHKHSESEQNDYHQEADKEHKHSDSDFKLPLPPPDDKYDLMTGLCKICDKSFKNTRALKQHFLRVHKQLLPKTKRLYVPKVCTKCGESSIAMKKHMRTHEGSLRCVHCTLIFKTPGRLKLHMRCHADMIENDEQLNNNKHANDTQKPKKGIICGMCGKEYKSTGNYNIHMKRHTKNYTMKCQYCDKGFFRAYDLQQHMAKHTKEYPYACELCPKTFKSRYILVGHMYQHLGVKKFVCVHCDRQYDTNQMLQQHYKLESCLRNKERKKKSNDDEDKDEKKSGNSAPSKKKIKKITDSLTVRNFEIILG